MVKLEEVPDEELNFTQPGPKEDEDEWDTDDSASSIASLEDDDDDLLSETLYDRLTALKDIVPPTYRKRIERASTTSYNWASYGLRMGGKSLWVLCTSALLLGVPFALALGEEQQLQEMEREMRMQQNATELLTQQQGQAKPAL